MSSGIYTDTASLASDDYDQLSDLGKRQAAIAGDHYAAALGGRASDLPEPPSYAVIFTSTRTCFRSRFARSFLGSSCSGCFSFSCSLDFLPAARQESMRLVAILNSRKSATV